LRSNATCVSKEEKYDVERVQWSKAKKRRSKSTTARRRTRKRREEVVARMKRYLFSLLFLSLSLV
jgi:hypothetical protein